MALPKALHVVAGRWLQGYRQPSSVTRKQTLEPSTQQRLGQAERHEIGHTPTSNNLITGGGGPKTVPFHNPTPSGVVGFFGPLEPIWQLK